MEAEKGSQNLITKDLSENKSIHIFYSFVYTKYQEILENSIILMNKKIENEAQPFEFKYQSKKKLLDLLKEIKQFEISNSEFEEIYECSKAILKYFLGICYFECEEFKDSETSLLESIEIFNKLKDGIKAKYLVFIQDVYNNLGIINCNRNEEMKSLKYFAMAEHIYNIAKEGTTYCINNNLLNFINNKTTQSNNIEIFGFFIDGGINKKDLELHYTQTSFFLAQAYAKLKKRDLSASYCAKTLQRQLEQNVEFNLKNWCINCVALSDYFSDNMSFAQAEYCIFAAFSLLPKDENKRKKLRAILQIELGKYYAKRLEIGIQHLKMNTGIAKLKSINDQANKKYVEFHGINIPWPIVTDIETLEDAKTLFRLANTQFKKALLYYVLDGYVTDHVKILKQISQLYRTLSLLETDSKRYIAMLERRRELLKSVADQINPKAFCELMQEVWSELIQILNEMFDFKQGEAERSKKSEKESFWIEQNSIATECISYALKLVDLLLTLDQQTDDVKDVISEEWFTVARLYSKLKFKDKVKLIESQKTSLQFYTKVKDSLSSRPKKDDPIWKEKYKLSQEMCQMMPLSISKIAYEAK